MAPDEAVQNIFGQFKKAHQRLKEAVVLPTQNPLKQDAVIQRFEFTYELLWKTFKRLARLEKIDCFSPREAFNYAFRKGLIADEKLFVEIIDARNMTTHVYAEDQAKKIYDFIQQNVVQAFDFVAQKLEQFIERADSK